MPAAKTMYVHIGLPKTGTSSIQLMLHAGAAALAKHGVIYPSDAKQVANHRTFVTAVGGRRIARVTGLDVAKCQASVADTIKVFRSNPTARALVWSHESLAGSVGRWEFRFLDEVATGLDLKVILYVRYTADWMESQYRQLVWGQSLRPVQGISRTELLDVAGLCKRWLRNIDAATLWDKVAERLPGADIIIRSFDLDRQHDRLMPEFLKVIAADESFAGTARDAANYVANASRPAVDTVLLHSVWRGGLDTAAINLLARSLVASLSLATAHQSGLHVRFIPQDCANSARAAYAASRERFPQLPAQPAADVPLTAADEVRDRVLARLETVRARIGEEAFGQIISVLQ